MLKPGMRVRFVVRVTTVQPDGVPHTACPTATGEVLAVGPNVLVRTLCGFVVRANLYAVEPF